MRHCGGGGGGVGDRRGGDVAGVGGDRRGGVEIVVEAVGPV